MFEIFENAYNSFINYFFADGFSPWQIVGLLGILTFGSRFLVQWIVTEWRRESVIPVTFWYLSIIGSLLMLTYALFYLRDPIVVLGYLPNSVIYFRNLYFVEKKKRQMGESDTFNLD